MGKFRYTDLTEGIDIFLKDEKKGEHVMAGRVIGDTYYRIVKPEHYMNYKKGYGIQVRIIDQLQELQVQNIVLIDEATGRRGKASLSMWFIEGSVANYGHGRQLFLHEKHLSDPLSVTPERLEALALTKKKDKEKEAKKVKQLPLI